MLRMPAACSIAISAATIAAVCVRPVRRSSFSTKDCTPRRDAVDAGGDPGARDFRRDVAGSGFDRGLRPGASGDQIEQRAQGIGSEIAGRAAAQIEGVGSPFPRVGADLARQRFAIARFEFARKNSAGEIAVGTLLRAERV